MRGHHLVPLTPGAIGAINADEVTHHHVPLTPGAIGAINADEVTHHHVPLTPGAIGAINADEVTHHHVPSTPGAIGAINALEAKAKSRWRNKPLHPQANQSRGLSAILREREGFVDQFDLTMENRKID